MFSQTATTIARTHSTARSSSSWINDKRARPRRASNFLTFTAAVSFSSSKKKSARHHHQQISRAGEVFSSVNTAAHAVRGRNSNTNVGTNSTTRSIKTNAQRGGGGNNNSGFSLVPVQDRVIAFLPYLLPLISGLRYSRYFFAAFPAAIIMLQPILPIVKIVATLPLGNLIPFFAAYLGVARNQNLSRFCRFNGMQAILLDIVLIFPGLLESLFSREILGIGIPYFLSKWMYNVIWVGLVVAFALCAVGCATGRYVQLPVVSEAAEAQMR